MTLSRGLVLLWQGPLYERLRRDMRLYKCLENTGVKVFMPRVYCYICAKCGLSVTINKSIYTLIVCALFNIHSDQTGTEMRHTIFGFLRKWVHDIGANLRG